MALLFGASSIPDTSDSAVGGFIFLLEPRWQNLLHVPAYAGLAYLWWRALLARGKSRAAAAVIAAAIAVLYGITDEFHQTFVPGRYGSGTDVLLDAAGAATVLLWARRRR